MKPSAFILIASLLTTVTYAGKARSPKNEVTVTTKHISDLPVMDNELAPVEEAKEDTTPAEKRSEGTHSLVQRDYHLSCLIPHQGQEPDMDDCFSVCEFLNEQNPFIEVPPDDTVVVNSGICEFTMFNTGCFYHSFSGASVYNACRQMLQHCVYSGFDGLLDDPSGNDMAYSLTGTESAPQYQHPSCPAS